MKYIIGSREEADIHLDVPSVAEAHASLSVDEDGQITLSDLGGTEGTYIYLDNRWLHITSAPVATEDRVRLGKHETTIGALLDSTRDKLAASGYIRYSRDPETGEITAYHISPAAQPMAPIAPASGSSASRGQPESASSRGASSHGRTRYALLLIPVLMVLGYGAYEFAPRWLPSEPHPSGDVAERTSDAEAGSDSAASGSADTAGSERPTQRDIAMADIEEPAPLPDRDAEDRGTEAERNDRPGADTSGDAGATSQSAGSGDAAEPVTENGNSDPDSGEEGESADQTPREAGIDTQADTDEALASGQNDTGEGETPGSEPEGRGEGESVTEDTSATVSGSATEPRNGLVAAPTTSSGSDPAEDTRTVDEANPPGEGGASEVAATTAPAEGEAERQAGDASTENAPETNEDAAESDSLVGDTPGGEASTDDDGAAGAIDAPLPGDDPDTGPTEDTPTMQAEADAARSDSSDGAAGADDPPTEEETGGQQLEVEVEPQEETPPGGVDTAAEENGDAALRERLAAFEEMTYRDAGEDRERLATYLENCTVCVFRDEAEATIARLDAVAPETECDRLAAAPDDGGKLETVPGIRWDALDVAPALLACGLAHQQYPNEPRILFQLGRIYEKDERFEKAREYYSRSVEAVYGAGMTGMGDLYYGGSGVEKDYSKASEWYRRGAEQNDPGAIKRLGSMYREGEGVSKNYAQAMRLFERAADLGNSNAINAIGYMYMEGEGVERDYAEAMRWYRRSVELHSPAGMHNIGYLHSKGHGVPKDYAEAMRWYRRAADLGLSVSMTAIGRLYYNGHGVTKDYNEARRWYQMAIDASNNGGAYWEMAVLHSWGRGVQRDYRLSGEYAFKAVLYGDSGALEQAKQNRADPAFKREIQRQLKQHGAYDGAIDGAIGPATRRALDAVFDTGE